MATAEAMAPNIATSLLDHWYGINIFSLFHLNVEQIINVKVYLLKLGFSDTLNTISVSLDDFFPTCRIYRPSCNDSRTIDRYLQVEKFII